MVPKVVNLSS